MVYIPDGWEKSTFPNVDVYKRARSHSQGEKENKHCTFKKDQLIRFSVKICRGLKQLILQRCSVGPRKDERTYSVWCAICAVFFFKTQTEEELHNVFKMAAAHGLYVTKPACSKRNFITKIASHSP